MLLWALVSEEADREARGREVSGERALSLLPSSNFQSTAECEDLEKSGGGDLEDGLMTTRDISEGNALTVGEHARKADTTPSSQVAQAESV